jgi:hypothetical protein
MAKSKETKVNECGATERSICRRGVALSLRAFPAFADHSHDLRSIDINVHTRYIERRCGSRLRFDEEVFFHVADIKAVGDQLARVCDVT